MHTPDNWIVFKLRLEKPIYKILAGWSGGYLHGSSWRINSGISKVEEEGDYFLFYGHTGSVYKCHKESYCLRGNNSYIWEQLKERHESLVEMVPEDTDWKGLFNGG